MLFFTRDARCKRSMDDFLVGEMEESLNAFSVPTRFGVPGSRFCQKRCGEEPSAEVNGEDWNGDESPLRLRLIFYVRISF